MRSRTCPVDALTFPLQPVPHKGVLVDRCLKVCSCYWSAIFPQGGSSDLRLQQGLLCRISRPRLLRCWSLSRNLTLLSQVLVFGVEMHGSVLVVHEIPAAGRREVEQDRALPAYESQGGQTQS